MSMPRATPRPSPDSHFDLLLLSTYEQGHQPLGLARSAAALCAAGFEVRCRDLSVEPLDDDGVRRADFVGISIPMHTATRLGVRLARRVRALNPSAHICFFGLYAPLNAEYLLEQGADSVIGGELEQPLVALADHLRTSRRDRFSPPSGVITRFGGGTSFERQQFPLPERGLLPPLERYSRFDDGQHQKLAGYVEASRGCAHRCLHCPITPVYQGRMRIVQAQVVLADIRQLVALGAEHVTFGDPDFFNAVKHSAQIVTALHEEFPALSYDATIKVEHLLEHRHLLPLLKATGCAFVVSAVESVDDTILGHLAKGHTAADVDAALELCSAAGLVLRPTFVAFTPWTSLESFLGLLEFVEQRGLIYHVDSVQFAVRLLVPPGSSLLGTSAMAPYLGELDAETLSYAWRHPDPRLDSLQEAVAATVERSAANGLDPLTTFYQIKSQALAALAGRATDPDRLRPARSEQVPRLTEPWFC